MATTIEELQIEPELQEKVGRANTVSLIDVEAQGPENYHSNGNWQPFFDQIHEVEMRMKDGWQNHYSVANQSVYSRVKEIVEDNIVSESVRGIGRFVKGLFGIKTKTWRESLDDRLSQLEISKPKLVLSPSKTETPFYELDEWKRDLIAEDVYYFMENSKVKTKTPVVLFRGGISPTEKINVRIEDFVSAPIDPKCEFGGILIDSEQKVPAIYTNGNSNGNGHVLQLDEANEKSFIEIAEEYLQRPKNGYTIVPGKNGLVSRNGVNGNHKVNGRTSIERIFEEPKQLDLFENNVPDRQLNLFNYMDENTTNYGVKAEVIGTNFDEELSRIIGGYGKDVYALDKRLDVLDKYVNGKKWGRLVFNPQEVREQLSKLRNSKTLSKKLDEGKLSFTKRQVEDLFNKIEYRLDNSATNEEAQVQSLQDSRNSLTNPEYFISANG